MRFFSIVAAGLAVFAAVPALAAPAAPGRGPRKSVERVRGATTGKYIVKFKNGVSRKSFASKFGIKPSGDWDLLNGFAANIDNSTLEALQESDDVEYIAEDGMMYAIATQTNAPWGLGRIDQAAKLSGSVSNLNFQYTYNDKAGEGVDVYVIDTGVRVAHSEFGGRARWGVSYVSETTDGNGHGTHCAGTVAGTRYGVAKKANIIAVQVLSSSGSGSNSGVISGLNWIGTQAKASGRPSVVSMSLGGSAATSVDNAVAALTAAGVHVVVAAGNDNANAANYSPARAPSAITVGATTIADARSSFSNYGALVDVFAPGTSITSAWHTSNSATNSISGTSMATPHVAGLVAYLISVEGNRTPAAMADRIKALAVKNVLTGIPSGTTNALIQLPL